jgi:hypothetical protein
MAYSPTTWVDNDAPALDAEHLNKIETGIRDAHLEKQDTLVSGTNIKTVNGTTLLGSGDVEIPHASQTVYGTAKMYVSGSTLYITTV